jgi:hypothetical protein
MIIAVIGSRSIVDYRIVEQILDQYIITHIISGGAIGIDRLAEQYANEHNIPTTIIKPDWKTYGKAAGIIRNKEIVGKADQIIAIWDGISKGTKSSIDFANVANKQTHIHKYSIL